MRFRDGIVSIEYAQDAPYWDTSHSTPDKQRELVVKVLVKWGVETYGWMHEDGFETLYFNIGEERYKIAVKPLDAPKYKSPRSSESKLRERAAVQAWRLVYHYVKASLEMAAWNDPATMLLPFLLLPSGETLNEVPIESLARNALPAPEPVR